MFNNKKGLITASVLIPAVIIGTYLISSNKADPLGVIPRKEGTGEKKVTAVKARTVERTTATQKTVSNKHKAKSEDIKLKPHYLYVRSKEQRERDFKQRQEMQRRFFQMKKTRDDQMKNKQFQERVNKTKGKENV